MNAFRSPRLPALSVTGTQPTAQTQKSPSVPIGTCLIDSPRDNGMTRRQVGRAGPRSEMLLPDLWSFHERNRGAAVPAIKKRQPLPDIPSRQAEYTPFRFRPTNETKSRDTSRGDLRHTSSEEAWPWVKGVGQVPRVPLVPSTTDPEPSPAGDSDEEEMEKARNQADINSLLASASAQALTPNSGSWQRTTTEDAATIGYQGDDDSVAPSVPRPTAKRARSGRKGLSVSLPLLVQGMEMLPDQSKPKNPADTSKGRDDLELLPRQTSGKNNKDLPAPLVQKITLTAPPDKNKPAPALEVPPDPAKEKTPSPRRIVVDVTLPMEATPREIDEPQEEVGTARKKILREVEEGDTEDNAEVSSMFPNGYATSKYATDSVEDSSRRSSTTSIEADWEDVGHTTSVPDTHRTLAELLGTNDYARSSDASRMQWSQIAFRKKLSCKPDNPEQEDPEDRELQWLGKFDSAVVDKATYNDFARTSKPSLDLPPRESKAPRVLKAPNIRPRVPELPDSKQMNAKCLPLLMKESSAFRKLDNMAPKRNAKLRITLSNHRP